MHAVKSMQLQLPAIHVIHGYSWSPPIDIDHANEH